jgi:hypothetical protein
VPHLLSWGGADGNLSGTTPGANSPVEIKVGGGATLWVNLASNIQAVNGEILLIVEEPANRSDPASSSLAAADLSVVNVIPGVIATTAATGGRTMRADNTQTVVGSFTPPFLCVPIGFDLRPLRLGPNTKFYLAISNMGGAATIYLLNYTTSQSAL